MIYNQDKNAKFSHTKRPITRSNPNQNLLEMESKRYKDIDTKILWYLEFYCMLPEK